MKRLSFSILILSSVIASCAALTTPALAVQLVSRSQEVSIGKEVQADAIREYGGLDPDPRLANKVATIGANVARVSPRQDVKYTYQVLNSSIINAFAAPGGPVMITKGLAKILTDNELAFVLGHETGHIAAQHGRDAINRAMLTQGIAGLLFGGSSNTVQMGVNMMYTLYDRGYSRNQEYQADEYGVKLMKQAGYNTEGSITALAKLGMKRSSGLNKYLSTHPDVPDRINRVARLAGVTPQRAQELIRQVQSQPQ